jgi:predicted glycoside hydrolase/deacetylase ChbG (UPF0249 family)
MKSVIINADDYGYRPDVSKAIIDSHQHGVLTSTTVLINFIPQEQVTQALSQEKLGLGLHLNITSGTPLTAQWKEKYGGFTRPAKDTQQEFYREVWVEFFQKFDTEDIYQEYSAQLAKFIELFGRKPTHLDSHHYTSAFPQVFPAFLRIAKENGLPVRPQVMFDWAANQHPMGNINHIGDLNQQLKQESVKSVDYFSLLYPNRYDNYLEVIANELERIADGQSIELSCHPGYDEAWRKKDLDIMKDPKLQELIETMNCKLITYSDLI